jgi:hypothetical protein
VEAGQAAQKVAAKAAVAGLAETGPGAPGTEVAARLFCNEYTCTRWAHTRDGTQTVSRRETESAGSAHHTGPQQPAAQGAQAHSSSRQRYSLRSVQAASRHTRRVERGLARLIGEGLDVLGELVNMRLVCSLGQPTPVAHQAPAAREDDNYCGE